MSAAALVSPTITSASADIGMAVTESQAVLQLVADRLRADGPLAADVAFTLFAAVTVAIDRLDVVHDVLHAADDAAVAAHSLGVMQ